MSIPIIFNVEAVNSQNEASVRAARRGGVKLCNYSWKATRQKLPRGSWERSAGSAKAGSRRVKRGERCQRKTARFGAVVLGINRNTKNPTHMYVRTRFVRRRSANREAVALPRSEKTGGGWSGVGVGAAGVTSEPPVLRVLRIDF